MLRIKMYQNHTGAGAIRPLFLYMTALTKGQPERKCFVTNAEMNYIIRHRRAGKGCAEIARTLGLSANTVKSFCRRNSIVPDEQASPTDSAETKCLQCGKAVIRSPHRKAKRFCSDACRLTWWHSHRDLARNALERRCRYCGMVFHSVREQKYCSRRCYFAARYGGTSSERIADQRAV